MKVLVIVGTQLRHQYFLSTMENGFEIAGVIEYERSLVQSPKLPKHVFLPEDVDFEKDHLLRLYESEQKYFELETVSIDKTKYPLIKVTDENELNSENTIEWVRAVGADVMIDYGSGIIRNDLISVMPEWKINMHGGLSPYYKGSATLFWPFYFQQPELAGATFHLMSSRIDGGNILQHVRPTMQGDDSPTDIMSRCIVQASSAGVHLLDKLRKYGNLKSQPQKYSGKLFLERDYKPSCLRVMYRLFEDGMISQYLKNKRVIDSQYKFFDQLFS